MLRCCCWCGVSLALQDGGGSQIKGNLTASCKPNSSDANVVLRPLNLTNQLTEKGTSQPEKLCFQSHVSNRCVNQPLWPWWCSSCRTPADEVITWAKLTGGIETPSTTECCCGCSITFPPCRAASAAEAAHLQLTFALFIWPPCLSADLEGELSSAWWTQHHKVSRLGRKENVIMEFCFDTFVMCAFMNAATFMMKHHPKCRTASGHHAET